MSLNPPRIVFGFAFFITVYSAFGQLGGFPSGGRPRTGQTPVRAVVAPVVKMRNATELIRRQDPIKVNQALLKGATPDRVRVVVSLAKQRAYLLIGEEVVVDSPISSGKRGHTSPSGSFSVLEKDANHHSSIYGDFVDSSGRVVRAGVSAKIDSAPSGTHFDGATMKWFMRLTDEGVGMHVAILPVIPLHTVASECPKKGQSCFTIM